MARIIFAALFAMILSACSTTVQQTATMPLSADSKSAGLVSVQQSAVMEIPADYEIEDVRVLPQDFEAYAASSSRNSLDTACCDTLRSEFKQKYFAPWRGSKPLSDITRSVLTMEEHAKNDWYGANRRKIPGRTLDELLANCDLQHFPSLYTPAIAIVPSFMRVLPTASPFLEKSDDFPFDALQNAGLKMNEPIRVLHVSTDGVWAFAETADANGWVPLRDIGFVTEQMAAERMRGEQVVIVKDFAPMRDSHEQFAVRAKVGTLLPLVGEFGDDYEVSVAVKSGSAGVREIKVRVPKDSARRFPLAVNGETVALVGNQLVGTPYGWGELFQGRDCSALMRDFFLPFGIWLPRGSYNQINSGKSISLAGMTTVEKERFIRENAVPFLTILHMNGHIMLYVGSRDGKALIFHSLWKVRIKDREGHNVKQVVGKAIISTLTPGSELWLATGPLLEKVRSMLILSNRCTVTN
ncbi:MAG: NlpC/P60 family N-terminal domain-containing protein [Geobacteraceae bacterium]|nr:NlpC/P60 family N-terminal domain-containing protein [Geobacteraceae bacterium]